MPKKNRYEDPGAELLIAVRLMHLDHLKTYADKARLIIEELRLYGYEIVKTSNGKQSASSAKED